MAEPLPQLPADFLDKAPPTELPHDFFEKQGKSVASTPNGPQRTSKLKLKPRERKEGDYESEAEKFQSEGGFSSIPFFSRAQAGMKGLREGKPADFFGNLAGAGAELIRPEAETIATIETGKGVYGAGKALLKGSAKPAIGLAAGIGTGYIVDKATRALGLPGWLPEILGGLAGAKVGGKVGMSPEAIEAFESGGVKGLIKKLLGGGTSENEAFEFYKETHGRAPKTGAEKLTARAEAAAYKKQVAERLKPIAEKPNNAIIPNIEHTPSGKFKLQRASGGGGEEIYHGGSRQGKQFTQPGPLIPEQAPPEPEQPWIPNIEYTPAKPKLRPKPSYTPRSEEHAGGGSRTQPRYGEISRRQAAEDAEREAKQAGVTPMGKLKIRGDIFSNLDQAAEKAGANKTEFKKSFRAIVQQKYGKGLSEMSEEELMQVANSVQELLQK